MSEGLNTQTANGMPVAIARGPIHFDRIAGAINLTYKNVPTAVPAGAAAISSPTAIGPPPIATPYGAASASGITYRPASQQKPSNVRRVGSAATYFTPATTVSRYESCTFWSVLTGLR